MFRQDNIESVKRNLGWAYSNMKWLTDEQAEDANQEREELINSISKKFRYSFSQNKLHIGRLSPGCSICGQGSWSCMFINGLCTANCFYCAQDRKIEEERPPKIAEGPKFDNPSDYVDYLDKFNIQGVGFSGGEPLLVFPKLLEFIKKIRTKLGEKIYIWVYTNGGLVDKDKLHRLTKAGLNEIRFDISASGYNLEPVKLAAGIIDTVTVEIPAIPEDFKIAAESLPAIEKLGVKYLNIHQLFATRFNYGNFIKRGYTFLHNAPNISVLESEISALKLLNFAINKGLSLPINYCSTIYKSRLQGKGELLRMARFAKEGFEEITSIGYIRQLSFQGSTASINKIARALKNKKSPKNKWLLDASNKEIFIHSSLLKNAVFEKANLIIRYFEPKFKTCDCPVCSSLAYKAIKLNSIGKLYIRKDAVVEKRLGSPQAIQAFRKLFIENIKDNQSIFQDLLGDYNSNTRNELDALVSLKNWEFLASGWPEIY
ncbi:MAG: 4Fe-4S cluster-binding domain-containing protein [Candidatus Omnitrophica bacterium]|nr:4Fe-4S cluster-binding domain-containing protein [Candidatus Omnitrophota bacterium]HOX54091.1 4Fe-4S cluster-binding domain-containing protein [Candidatus Omnitrophota bacterium]